MQISPMSRVNVTMRLMCEECVSLLAQRLSEIFIMWKKDLNHQKLQMGGSGSIHLSTDKQKSWSKSNIVQLGEMKYELRFFYHVLSANIAPTSDTNEIYQARMTMLYRLAMEHGLNYDSHL